MSMKRRSIIVAVTAAGVVGLGAPMASAGSYGHSEPSVDNEVTSGLVNVNDNQVSGQACGNDVPVNVIGGQVPVDDVLAVAGIGAEGNTAVIDNSCQQASFKKD